MAFHSLREERLLGHLHGQQLKLLQAGFLDSSDSETSQGRDLLLDLSRRQGGVLDQQLLDVLLQGLGDDGRSPTSSLPQRDRVLRILPGMGQNPAKGGLVASGSLSWILMLLRETPAFLSSIAALLTSFEWCLMEVLITGGMAKWNWLNADKCGLL